MKATIKHGTGKEMQLKLLESITKDSKLSEKDIEELGDKIKAGIAKAHEKRAGKLF